ncbi:hypothetical protein PQQ52_19250 [Paraburkholderia sediminicola]|uniref:hypothetical protein n=1 Tax=Paraburkholderia sediminicola TaxID=458836 RepID=UPI0038BCFFB4
MTVSSNLDDKARAETLCYLVVGQLVARARTGSWLRTDRCAEVLSIWLKGNGTEANWLDSVHLVALSEKVALDFVKLPNFADSTRLAELFTDSCRMNYRSPGVWNIHAACENELKTG